VVIRVCHLANARGSAQRFSSQGQVVTSGKWGRTQLCDHISSVEQSTEINYLSKSQSSPPIFYLSKSKSIRQKSYLSKSKKVLMKKLLFK
jgi:hypothetical protein